MFRCVDNSCIPQIYVCNSIQDCPCYEDELMCNSSNEESLKLFPHIYFNKILNMSQVELFVILPDDTYYLLH